MEGGGTRLEFEDAIGRRWTALLDGREVLRSWTLFQGGRPTWWWRREAKGGRLSQRDGGRQLAWELVVEEPLRGELAAHEEPAGYRANCPETGVSP